MIELTTPFSEEAISQLKVGDVVNLEGDVVGKYVAKAAKPQGLTEEALVRAGFA